VLADVPARVNGFLGKAAAVVRERFGGRISYASLPSERVDWAPFDVIVTDAGCRSARTADRYRDDIRALVAQGTAQGKPVAITEFGCTTHRGAADLGDRGDTIVEWGDDGRPVRLNGDYTRDEDEQAAYLRELLDIFDAEGVDSAFWYTFARYDLPHRGDPREDLDMASYGVVKVLEDRRGRTYLSDHRSSPARATGCCCATSRLPRRGLALVVLPNCALHGDATPGGQPRPKGRRRVGGAARQDRSAR
jgi:hypothetical protein